MVTATLPSACFTAGRKSLLAFACVLLLSYTLGQGHLSIELPTHKVERRTEEGAEVKLCDLIKRLTVEPSWKQTFSFLLEQLLKFRQLATKLVQENPGFPWLSFG